MADDWMLPWGMQHPSIQPSPAGIREHRTPRQHPVCRLYLADWRSIRYDVLRLERKVHGLVDRVQGYKQRGLIDYVRLDVSTRILSEMIRQAQSIRERYSLLVCELTDIAIQDNMAGGTGLAHHWIDAMTQGFELFRLINRTLHVEKYWIRILISITPFYLSIDYHTLTWDNLTDREDCHNVVFLD